LRYFTSPVIEDLLDPERPWNYVGFTIEFEPLALTGVVGDYNQIVEVNGFHKFNFVFDLNDRKLKLLDNNGDILNEYSQIGAGEVASFYCTIGFPTEEAVPFYRVTC
jgi:hypothetical protein